MLSTTDALLYVIADAERLAAWQRYAYARSDKDPKPGQPPKPLPRPGERPAAVAAVPEARLLDFVERHRARTQEVSDAG